MKFVQNKIKNYERIKKVIFRNIFYHFRTKMYVWVSFWTNLNFRFQKIKFFPNKIFIKILIKASIRLLTKNDQLISGFYWSMLNISYKDEQRILKELSFFIFPIHLIKKTKRYECFEIEKIWIRQKIFEVGCKRNKKSYDL